MCCISDNDCNSWVDVVLVFDESTAVALSSGAFTCSRWDNGGGIISIRGEAGEGGEWFIGDKGVEKAMSLSFWRTSAARKVLSLIVCRTTLVGSNGCVIGFISESAAGAVMSDECWWFADSDDGQKIQSWGTTGHSYLASSWQSFRCLR